MLCKIKLQRLARYLAILAMFPLLIVMSAELTVALLQCTVKEALPTDCRIFNYDIGMILAVSYTAGWAALLTLPIAGVGAYICYIKSLRLRKP